MCRWCQRCWEDIYWNCFEERFCYDESIANYNPDDDNDYIISQNGASTIHHIEINDNNNLLQVPISDQPLRQDRNNIISAPKIHEKDYRRETQTNVPMLGPEILAVFANSQIFQDHQPTKLNRISTKSQFPGIHSSIRDIPNTPRETEQDRLIRRLEGTRDLYTIIADNLSGVHLEKHIKFASNSDASQQTSPILTPKKFDAIKEEVPEEKLYNKDEVVLRPRLLDRRRYLLLDGSDNQSKGIRCAKSVPHLYALVTTSETDIFSITGSGQISMTPEVPSISFNNLPKNYEDTPSIDKYRVTQSLYSIQSANAARMSQDDYSMPRYFRRSAFVTQVSEITQTSTIDANKSASSYEIHCPEKEKSKRLKMLRSNLPPLLIHSVSFRKSRDEVKQIQ